MKINSTTLLIVIIVILVISIIGVIVFGGKKEANNQGKEPTLPEEIYGLSGTITSIGEKEIFIDALIVYTDGSNETQSKRILVDENTKITTLEFPKITAEDRNKPIEQPKEIEIGFTDLKVGDKIEAIANENIVGKDEFLVKYINVIKLLM
ncbi:MAG: hypothetical protein A2V69_02010 [Candidatus Portnoybacteria bacterium RBG_13_40_8]|uniref:DUF5666 domain-containing protein n=1 Tax=Candidatus Portnoybacteria bacterium RBG_13_40_8 TaxID=1801990 RepID=A0A1G2F1W4_9BACT|nr:MAG: hypothetical protein A2V69_02010 [Candidatus Portnoybacteria bacterium RBG_13_40_8]